MKAPVGSLRPSQLMFTFGVGAVVDLPHISTMVMGLEDWPDRHSAPIVEDRLLASIRARSPFGSVETLLGAPIGDDSPGRPGNGNFHVGVPVAPFPRWLRCPTCDRLAPLSSGLFELKKNPFKPDKTRYVHTNCARAPKTAPTVLPARFLVACERGHLDDFPWVEFVHRGQAGCDYQLALAEPGISGEAKDILVICQACGVKRSMAEAFGEGDPDGRHSLPPCGGRRPHLRDREPACGEPMRAILLGASNSWFGVSLSLLSIPSSRDAVSDLVEAAWERLSHCSQLEHIALLRSMRLLGDLDGYPDEAILAAITAYRAGTAEQNAGSDDLKGPEWELFSNPDQARANPDFRIRSAGVPATFARWAADIVLAERLREVRALLGFTRIESPGNYADVAEIPPDRRAPLTRRAPRWLPATEVRGEGIFLRFHEAPLAEWCHEVDAREAQFREAHRLWRSARRIHPPDASFPGIRYILLHSLSHALMRQLSLACGYSAASIRERLYSREPGEEGGPMAGILLYTAAPDSEGTLGGLVALGRPHVLDGHIRQALADMQVCASDPLCAEHHPHGDGASLHGAACHACLFCPETSCERGNKYLDRALLVPTFADEVSPFFVHLTD